MSLKYHLKNLDCANCAQALETHLKNIPGINPVSVDFSTLTLHTDCDDFELLKREIERIEPEIELIPASMIDNGALRYEHEKLHYGRELAIIGVSGILFVLLLVFEPYFHRNKLIVLEWVIVISAYLFAGGNVLTGALRTIRRGIFFDENVLMTVATLSAMAIHAVTEAVGVMIFFKTGEFLQQIAVDRSRRSIVALLAARPSSANLKTPNGIVVIESEKVMPGAIIIVKPGEKIPLDGVVNDGVSELNTAALTGESMPKTVCPGDAVLAGEINLHGMITVTVTKIFEESVISGILEQVENAVAKKARTEFFISRFARYYTPVVVMLAAATALLPPLLFTGQTFSECIYRALVLLVISCPCALMVSIPLGYFGGIGGASRRGILIKGSNYLDVLANVKTVVFDKTGTLTTGTFTVQTIHPNTGFTKSDVLRLAALAESQSNHPIAKSIMAAYRHMSGTLDLSEVSAAKENAGTGVEVKVDGHTIVAGNIALMERKNILVTPIQTEGTVLYVGRDGEYIGAITLGDMLKTDAKAAIANLRKAGVTTIFMLTGDNQKAAECVASELRVDGFRAGLLPAQKVEALESLIRDHAHSGKIAFVGDGINDSPVLARADAGIAMGALGSDAAIETADVVLMSDRPSKVAEAILIGRNTKAIVWQNIIFVLAVKLVFVILGVVGCASMWEAVFADVGTTLLAVINSTRALRIPNSAKSQSEGLLE